MDIPLQMDCVVVFGLLFAILAFVVREVAGGVLRAMGQDLWRSSRRRRGQERDHKKGTEAGP